MRVRLPKLLLTFAALVMAAPATAQFSLPPPAKFLQAVKDRDGTVATELLNDPSQNVVNARDDQGRTGLFYLIKDRDETWLRFLLGKGANPNIGDNDGNTPLIQAAVVGWGGGVRYLLLGGARVDETNHAGETALIRAVEAHNPEVVRLLLQAGADPDRRDHIAGMSARDYAARDTRDAPILEMIQQDARKHAATGTNEGPPLDFSGKPL